LDGDICHADVGRCIFSGDTPEALDMAVAGAATDCLKRCFRQLGEQFGNSLYDKEIAKTAGLENGVSGNPAEARRSTQRGKPRKSITAPRQRIPLHRQANPKYYSTVTARLSL
jgi:hypothetical protein